MEQYLALCRRVIDEGVWVENTRTGKRCLTVINADLEYDCSQGILPVLTTKKMAWRMAIAEMLGYLRGYDSAAEFRSIGCTTWDANANENDAWNGNPYRKGPDDMGRVYGVQGRQWINSKGERFDQLEAVYNDLRRGVDNRREIVTFYNPGELHMGCLAPCMHTHTFSVLDGTLYLTSYQRSCDLALGVPFNMIQCGWLLLVMAHLTGLKPGKAYHKLVNVHIYEDQLDILVGTQLHREPYQQPHLEIEGDLSMETLLSADSPVSSFDLPDYRHHPAIAYPFSV